MATTKKPATKGAGASEKAGTKAGAGELASVTKTVQQAVQRALQARQIQPKIRGPIFVGIWYNPVTKQFEAINQFE
jgi:hypothetical protein